MKEFNPWPKPPRPRYSKHEPEHTLRPAVAKRTASSSANFPGGPPHRTTPNPYPKPHGSGEPSITFVSHPTLPVTRNRGKRTSPGSKSGSPSSKDIQHLANNRLKKFGK